MFQSLDVWFYCRYGRRHRRRACGGGGDSGVSTPFSAKPRREGTGSRYPAKVKVDPRAEMVEGGNIKSCPGLLTPMAQDPRYTGKP